jgi:hypothetical protein
MSTPDGDQLAAVLARIPVGDYSHVIDCARGWYPLLVRLDQTLAALDPGYEVHGVTAVDGALRFYAMPTGASEPACCTNWRTENADPGRVGSDDRWESWFAAWNTHKASPDHADPIRRSFGEAIRDAERESLRTCESCGQPGELCAGRMHLCRTLCQTCRLEL